MSTASAEDAPQADGAEAAVDISKLGIAEAPATRATAEARGVATPATPEKSEEQQVAEPGKPAAQVNAESEAAVEPEAPEASKTVNGTAREGRPEEKDDSPAGDAEQAPSLEGDGAGDPPDASNLVANDFEVKVKLVDLQADPNSPLYSVKSFQELGLAPELLKGLTAMRFQKPSKIQERALPLLLGTPPRNFIGQSQSGTGKTAAFTLTMLTRIDPAVASCQALCLLPSRELARQTLEVAETMAKFTATTFGLAVPGAVPRKERLQAQFVVGTPGTVVDLLRSRQLDVSALKVFVLDEADNMLDAQGLGSQCLRCKKLLPPNIQLVLFSATFPDNVYDFAQRFVPHANEIRLQHTELNVSEIKQMYMDCASDAAKFDAIVSMYGLLTIGSSIIFVRTRKTADDLCRRLVNEGHKVTVLHGDLRPEDRDREIDNFRQRRTKVLITTNVLSRGIDIPTVSMVVNYDLPTDADGRPDPTTYLHRIGRTGRFGRVGVAISFVHDAASYNVLQSIMDYFGDSVKITQLPMDDFATMYKVVKRALQE